MPRWTKIRTRSFSRNKTFLQSKKKKKKIVLGYHRIPEENDYIASVEDYAHQPYETRRLLYVVSFVIFFFFKFLIANVLHTAQTPQASLTRWPRIPDVLFSCRPMLRSKTSYTRSISRQPFSTCLDARRDGPLTHPLTTAARGCRRLFVGHWND